MSGKGEPRGHAHRRCENSEYCGCQGFRVPPSPRHWALLQSWIPPFTKHSMSSSLHKSFWVAMATLVPASSHLGHWKTWPANLSSCSSHPPKTQPAGSKRWTVSAPTLKTAETLLPPVVLGAGRAQHHHPPPEMPPAPPEARGRCRGCQARKWGLQGWVTAAPVQGLEVGKMRGILEYQLPSLAGT